MEEENKIIKDIYEPYFSQFPDYYKVFSELLNNVIYKDNDCSFPLKYKLFYGLMASSTMGCEYLLEDFKRIFLNLVGDVSWVEQGLKCKDIPENIKGIASINNILAHKPWIMDWRYFAGFKNGLSSFLFQSAIILSTIQRFATILSTFKIMIYFDILEDKKKDDNLEKEEEKTKEETDKNEEKEEKEVKEKNDDEKDKSDEEKDKNEDINEIKRKKKKKKAEKIEEDMQKVIKSIKNKIEFKEVEEEKNNATNKKEIFKKYIYELIDSYSDFNPHVEKYLYVEDFSWKTEAKYFFIDLARKDMEYLEKEFNFLENMILENETKTEAIKNYVMLIFGIRDNEYNYHNNNLYLSLEEKRIIKKIACYPEQIHQQELSECLTQLSKKQFIHLIFIVAATKQKISLTFFAKTFEEFRSQNL